MFFRKQLLPIRINSFLNVLTNIQQIASASIPFATKGIFENYFFGDSFDSVVVHLPPVLLASIIDIAEIVPIFGDAVVD